MWVRRERERSGVRVGLERLPSLVKARRRAFSCQQASKISYLHCTVRTTLDEVMYCNCTHCIHISYLNCSFFILFFLKNFCLFIHLIIFQLPNPNAARCVDTLPCSSPPVPPPPPLPDFSFDLLLAFFFSSSTGITPSSSTRPTPSPVLCPLHRHARHAVSRLPSTNVQFAALPRAHSRAANHTNSPVLTHPLTNPLTNPLHLQPNPHPQHSLLRSLLVRHHFEALQIVLIIIHYVFLVMIQPLL